MSTKLIRFPDTDNLFVKIDRRSKALLSFDIFYLFVLSQHIGVIYGEQERHAKLEVSVLDILFRQRFLQVSTLNNSTISVLVKNVRS